MSDVVFGPGGRRVIGGLRRLEWLVCALVVSGGPAFAQPASVPGQPARYLVVPFEDASATPRGHWLTEGSAVAITDDLVALGVPAISRDDRLRAFERLRVPPVASLSYATVIRLGQVVGAAQVIVGRFDVAGETLTVRARTIRLDVGRMSSEIVEEGPLPDLFAIYGRIARRIVPDARVTLEEMEQDHPVPAAFEQYIKGLLAEAPAAKIGHLVEAIRLAPAFQRARIALWSAHHEQGDDDEALAAIRDVPATHRLARKARFLATISLLGLGRYDDATAGLTALNQSMPDPSLLNNLGVVQLRRPPGSQGGRAVSFFGEAAKLDPSDPDIYFNLGYAYWTDRDTPSAIAWLREAVRRDPADAEAHHVLGVALQSAGSTAEGVREIELAQRLSSTIGERISKQAGATVPRGLERVKTGIDVPAALRVETAIVAAGRRDQRELATFHLEAGRRFFEAERDTEAISELRRAVYLAPYQSEAHLLLGRLYLRNGRLPDAADAFKIAIWSEDSLPAHVALAEAYIALKNLDGARSEIQLVLGRDAANAEARRLLEMLSVP
jgi:Flp pilus assembly protein TadD